MGDLHIEPGIGGNHLPDVCGLKVLMRKKSQEESESVPVEVNEMFKVAR